MSLLGGCFFAFQGTRADPARFGHDDRQDLCDGDGRVGEWARGRVGEWVM